MTKPTTVTPTKVVAKPTQQQVQVRMQKMNAMKQRMAQMSPSERSEAIKEMGANMPHDMQEKMQNKMQEVEHMQEGSQEHASKMQTRESEEMAQHQNMNQQQAGDQFEHGVSEGTYNTQNFDRNELQNKFEGH